MDLTRRYKEDTLGESGLIKRQPSMEGDKPLFEFLSVPFDHDLVLPASYLPTVALQPRRSHNTAGLNWPPDEIFDATTIADSSVLSTDESVYSQYTPILDNTFAGSQMFQLPFSNGSDQHTNPS